LWREFSGRLATVKKNARDDALRRNEDDWPFIFPAARLANAAVSTLAMRVLGNNFYVQTEMNQTSSTRQVFRHYHDGRNGLAQLSRARFHDW